MSRDYVSFVFLMLFVSELFNKQFTRRKGYYWQSCTFMRKNKTLLENYIRSAVNYSFVTVDVLFSLISSILTIIRFGSLLHFNCS